jgi:hypothetical protein
MQKKMDPQTRVIVGVLCVASLTAYSALLLRSTRDPGCPGLRLLV